MQIFDSVKKSKVTFEPINKGKVSIYVCGPTVYDNAHLGHARSALSFDLLRRILEVLGYEVTFAKNFTDIDDKIIKKIHESGKSLQELTDYYIKRYLEEMGALGVKRADIEPKATESLEAITAMVNNLIQKGCAYKTSSGDIYFDTTKDKYYGEISHMISDEEEVRSRLCNIKTEQKRNPRDFALWKACAGDEDICFDNRLGLGRPGWHIECSAMIEKYFKGNEKYSIDIHGGGADLLFPHHENEASQTRCCTGHEIAKYWMHNGFVQIDGEKMSKSLGNSFFLKDALALYSGELLRFYLISVHYRNDFNFNEVDLKASKRRLDKLYRLKKRVANSKICEVDREFKKALIEAMSDDLNTSKAFAIIDDMINSANETLDNSPKDKLLKRTVLANISFIDTLLGVGGSDCYEWFQYGVNSKERQKIEELIKKRNEAKKSKDFNRADTIRDELTNMGISLMDTVDGTKWERI